MLYNKVMNCHNSCNQCDRSCGCPATYLGIESLPDNISVLRFNLDGKRTDYDYQNLVYQTQTDTSLVADIINRLLAYSAERHTDTITAQELGSILHLADLGDVSTANATAGSLLTYQQANNCGEGCVGTQDNWKIWNALDEQTNSSTYPMMYSANGLPNILERPQSPNQYYMLGWNANSQVSYSQPQIVDASSVEDPNNNGKKIALYMDPTTKRIVGVYE